MHSPRVIDAAMRDLSAAETAEAGLPRWFRNVWLAEPQPLAADVWVFTADFERILVVEHRWRGLVPPGGKVEPGDPTGRRGTRAGGRDGPGSSCLRCTGLRRCPVVRA